ncbi:MAG: cytochrome C oxidase subunit II [Spirochaetia bacterium]|nr:cytochrome C oxidase subunit II [Spirochaetia bacterium]
MENMELHSGIMPVKGIWWKPAPAQEKRWVIISFIWCLILFAMMPLWHFKGGQNPAGIRTRVTADEFETRLNKFIKDYQVGEEKGIPVVQPPAGSDVYIAARMWQWSPILKLKKGAEYTIHLSSLDANHGFSLYPARLNFQVVPGYDYGLKMAPDQAGTFYIICNEFCGINHHNMIGEIIVEE